jgi:hypothetical protein
MATGKSLELANMLPPAPIVLHRNIGAPRSVRRNKRKLKAWKGALVTNDSYDYPARDERKARRLR